MTTLAEHISLVAQRNNWIHAKQAKYDVQYQRWRLAQSGGIAALRAATEALVPFARELDSAAERAYLALVPALRAANEPVAGQRASEIEALRLLTQTGVTLWATAQGALQTYRGGAATMSPMRVPAWQAYTVGPTGLIGLMRETGQTISEINVVAQGESYIHEQARQIAAEAGTAATRAAAEEIRRQQTTEAEKWKPYYGVAIGIAVLGGLWYLNNWWNEVQRIRR
jgi:hypothetical protein